MSVSVNGGTERTSSAARSGITNTSFETMRNALALSRILWLAPIHRSFVCGRYHSEEAFRESPRDRRGGAVRPRPYSFECLPLLPEEPAGQEPEPVLGQEPEPVLGQEQPSAAAAERERAGAAGAERTGPWPQHHRPSPLLPRPYTRPRPSRHQPWPPWPWRRQRRPARPGRERAKRPAGPPPASPPVSSTSSI